MGVIMQSIRKQVRSGHRLKKVIVLVLLYLLCLPGISASVDDKRFEAYIEKHSQGWIDWDEGLIYGVGQGYLQKNRNNRPLSKGVAGVLASGSIVKLAAGLNLDDARTLETLGDGKVVVRLKAFMRDREYKTTFIENGDNPYYEVIKVAEIKGIKGLTAKLLDQFSEEQVWKDFPIKPVTPQVEMDDSGESWLLLDARDLANNDKVQPALFPKIKSETGEVVYEISNVEEAALINRGMMSYVVSDASQESLRSDSHLVDNLLARAGLIFGVDEAQARTVERSLSQIPVPGAQAPVAAAPAPQNVPRKKRGRYYVMDVKDAEGLAKTNLVVSANDAMELKVEDSASHILKKCRVVVLVSSPIGGIEGANPQLLAMNNIPH